MPYDLQGLDSLELGLKLELCSLNNELKRVDNELLYAPKSLSRLCGVCILFSSVENAEIEDSGEWISILMMGLSLHSVMNCNT